MLRTSPKLEKNLKSGNKNCSICSSQPLRDWSNEIKSMVKILRISPSSKFTASKNVSKQAQIIAKQ